MPAFFGDVTQLRNQISRGGTVDFRQNPEALQAVAKQFEALYLQMVLKSMRQANQVIKSDLFSDQAAETYQSLYDQQLAFEITQQNSLGLTDMMVAQLTERGLGP